MSVKSRDTGWEAMPDAATNVVLGQQIAALATTATKGFPWVPTCAGTPTGTPSPTYTGFAPMVLDTTNNKIYFYYSSAWKGATVS